MKAGIPAKAENIPEQVESSFPSLHVQCQSPTIQACPFFFKSKDSYVSSPVLRSTQTKDSKLYPQTHSLKRGLLNENQYLTQYILSY